MTYAGGLVQISEMRPLRTISEAISAAERSIPAALIRRQA